MDAISSESSKLVVCWPVTKSFDARSTNLGVGAGEEVWLTFKAVGLGSGAVWPIISTGVGLESRIGFITLSVKVVEEEIRSKEEIRSNQSTITGGSWPTVGRISKSLEISWNLKKNHLHQISFPYKNKFYDQLGQYINNCLDQWGSQWTHMVVIYQRACLLYRGKDMGITYFWRNEA